MNILFIGTCGVYHPLVAAHLHLHKKDPVDYREVPFFGDYKLEKGGRPLAVGTDAASNQLFVLGVGPDVHMVKKSIEDLRVILGASAQELRVVPIMIKTQLLLLILHNCSGFAPFKNVFQPWITYLLNRQLPAIKKQLAFAFDEG